MRCIDHQPNAVASAVNRSTMNLLFAEYSMMRLIISSLSAQHAPSRAAIVGQADAGEKASDPGQPDGERVDQAGVDDCLVRVVAVSRVRVGASGGLCRMTHTTRSAFAVLRSALLVCMLCVSPMAAADPSEFEDLAVRDPDYAAGKAAIDNKNWKEAIARLQQSALREPENADIQNFLGYAHRNLKQFDLAFTHYKRAIELNPRHRGAHEYIGEAYLMSVRELGFLEGSGGNGHVLLLPSCVRKTEVDELDLVVLDAFHVPS